MVYWSSEGRFLDSSVKVYIHCSLQLKQGPAWFACRIVLVRAGFLCSSAMEQRVVKEIQQPPTKSAKLLYRRVLFLWNSGTD